MLGFWWCLINLLFGVIIFIGFIFIALLDFAVLYPDVFKLPADLGDSYCFFFILVKLTLGGFRAKFEFITLSTFSILLAD